MRILFSTTAGAGHFGPLVPIAAECLRRGHQVRVASPASFAATVEGAGLEHAPFADVPEDLLGRVFGRLPSLPREEANRTVLSEVFGRLDAQAALPGVTALIDDWRPDFVVREPVEFASHIAAERAGVPQATVAISTLAAERDLLAHVGEPLEELRALAGLAPLSAAQCVARLHALDTLTSVPRSLDGDEAEGRSRFRGWTADHGSGRLPAAWGDDRQPLVYVSFGSVTGSQAQFVGLPASVRDAFGERPYRVLFTTGEALDPADYGPWPENVLATRWWPQAEVMPLADAIVGHGGFGTTMAALAAGVPQVVLPLFSSDQYANAEAVDKAGVGVRVDGGAEALDDVVRAVDEVIGSALYRASAQRVAEEMAELPPVAAAVERLERLAS